MPAFSPGNLEGRDRISHIEEYLGTSKSDSLNRAAARTGGRGFVAETLDVFTAPPGNVLASQGASVATLTYVRAGDIFSNMTFYGVSAGGSNVYLKGGIWDTSGILLASTSGNPSTAFSTGITSYVTSALSAQYQPAADAFVYVGLAAAVAAGPRILGGAAPALNMNARVGSGFSFSASASTATSDALSVTWTPNANSAPWVGLT